MAGRGMFFAITEAQRDRLLGEPDDDARRRCLADIEAGSAPEFAAETDKAWEAMHRCLARLPSNEPLFAEAPPGSRRYGARGDVGDLPLRICVLGGRKIMDDEGRYIIRLIEPEDVSSVAAALPAITEDAMRDRYDATCEALAEYGDDDFDYMWQWFEDVRAFYGRVAPTGRSVIFTADQ